MAAVNILCLLGKVSSPDKGVEVDTAEARPNASKWVFDVEWDTGAEPSFSIELRDKNTGKVRTGFVLGPSIVPLDAAAAGAGIYLREHHGLHPVVITASNGVGIVNCRFTLDLIHSLER